MNANAQFLTVDFDWNGAKAFLLAAEKGSFTAAAKSLKVTHSTLSRQVSALEDRLGVVLFERTSKGPVLTENGEALVKFARQMSTAAEQLSLIATSKSEVVAGRVRISAPEVFALRTLPKFAKSLMQKHPGLEIEIISTDYTPNLLNRETDIAVLAVRPENTELIARRLRTVRTFLYGAKDYLNKVGRPEDKHALSQANFVGYGADNPILKAYFADVLNFRSSSYHAMSESSLIRWEMVKQGLGLGVMLDEVGDAEPDLERVLPDATERRYDIWLAVHRELRTSKKLQVTFDYLVELLAE